MPKCKPSDKYPLDMWKCNTKTGRYVKKVNAVADKKKTAEKARVDKIKEQIKAVREHCRASCDTIKSKADGKIAELKEKMHKHKNKLMFTPPFKGVAMQQIMM